ncbi:oxalate decarboxylase family bicupin [Phanerochaete sordida]|uniref:Oxalate decarboxylase family bicupin n=1 Tax=Phanerochaete sordida TaxID=48140 RepID=A0A9P3L8J8_9APHY|nr:oxalate decarboxylase family bicupin [Phanerochaete sordida]
MGNTSLAEAFLIAILLSGLTGAAPAAVSVATAPAAVSVASAAAPSPTVPYAQDLPNHVLWNEGSDVDPQPYRDGLGASPVLGPQNVQVDLQNPDLLAPPSTDSGTVGNAKWPFSLSHNRLQTGGWARQQNVKVMPLATEMAGVNMRLQAGALRELHWHTTAEWAYVLKGNMNVAVVNADGQNYLDTIGAGDMWYFPPGVPHVLQATDDLADGAEFLLVFDSGDFSEDSTFSITDWLSHVPKEVIAKNFGLPMDDFADLPGKELYIFPSEPLSKGTVVPKSSAGSAPLPYTFKASQMTPKALAGGSVKIIDSSNFQISKTIAAAEVTVEPGAIRELHWHPTEDEWSYFLEGTGRITLFASSGNARTFNFQPGDIGYVPASFGHYVENTGNTTLRFLEVFKSDKFEDISLGQWLALTPPEIVKAHLQLSDETISKLNTTKVVVAAPQH